MEDTKDLKDKLNNLIGKESFEDKFSLDKLLKDLELVIINYYLNKTNNLTQCAKAVGIGRTTFWMRYVEPNSKKKMEITK